MSDHTGLTLLGRLLHYYSSRVTDKWRNQKWCFTTGVAIMPQHHHGEPQLDEVLSLVSELVKEGSCLTALEKTIEERYLTLYRRQVTEVSFTPLLQLVRGTFQTYVVVDAPDPIYTLSIWIRLLKNCGADLERYGREEKDIHRNLKCESLEWQTSRPFHPFPTSKKAFSNLWLYALSILFMDLKLVTGASGSSWN
jgi:hypothetical protein